MLYQRNWKVPLLQEAEVRAWKDPFFQILSTSNIQLNLGLHVHLIMQQWMNGKTLLRQWNSWLLYQKFCNTAAGNFWATTSEREMYKGASRCPKKGRSKFLPYPNCFMKVFCFVQESCLILRKTRETSLHQLSVVLNCRHRFHKTAIDCK